ncbi:hypothetical protein A3G63_00175 [Candidatus Kaiserbacteria bacterium RIFCSPLOWO2_12_FULL_52_8]|uniref:Uncharacterized protein n=1 Tax=Candidatus Kaiserbacteria bacterium RIFCSPHIGHO2_01_FULL_53_31 TaxID=1798481 RepID=A0A1F6CHG5_9BACT|nr:MAG: hypothetical protein A2678_03175 [Candidatus Kaiserbacteria bacterium RIFCSPHIGHO2_01_FULL_53_31]OGG94438.1 MAG: hypothetical protein A3G63_00175 [Candidatus Kaiserbacteria bacterium RIFCSPLOWO2_12_FULL_52_8]
MFFNKESYSREGYEKAQEEQREVSGNLAEVVEETGQFPEEKDKQKRLDAAHNSYEAAGAKLDQLLKSGAKDAIEIDKEYDLLMSKRDDAEDKFDSAKKAYLAAQQEYKAVTEELEDFRRVKLGIDEPITLGEEREVLQ